jgi:membrane protein implicated in regulation of membrane protease activity
VLAGAHLPLRAHLPGFLHLPHFHFGGHASLPGAGHVSVPTAGQVSAPSGLAGRTVTESAHFSVFNFGTLMVFLAWFGGVGYLLNSYHRFAWLMVLAFAMLSGMTGAAIVFVFVAKVLLAHEQDCDAVDEQWPGVLGHVSVTIRAGGTGEIVFSQSGVRRVSGARSDDGSAIARGTEVVVTRYEKGIAYVRRWNELYDGAPAADLKGNENANAQKV